MKTTISILGCAAVLLASTLTAAQLPPGSYKDTCTGEAVVGDVLRAKCRTGAGALVDTSLNLPCNGSIDNINGKLTCAAPSAAGVPQGSYLQTCAGAKVAGNVLTADCRRADQSVNKGATLTLPCNGKIENLNGRLSCSGIPQGSYLQTCSGAAVKGAVLHAKCRSMSGGMVDTSLNLPCDGKIDNVNGKLACTGAAAHGVPPGSYLQTCGGAKVTGNVLTADCRRADQSVNKGATLTLPCTKRIENMNGRLACM